MAFLSYGTLMSLQGLWGGPFLIEVYGFDKATAGGILMFTAIGIIIGCPLGGVLSKHLAKKSIFISGVFLYTFAWLPLALIQNNLNFSTLSITLLTLGLAFGISFIMLSMVKEMFPIEIAGTALGSLNIFFFLGAASFQSSLGYFDSYSAMFKFCLGSMAIASLAVVFAGKNLS